MRILDPGHEYLLDSLDGGSPVLLRFVKRMGAKYPGNTSEHPGTTMQECLRALIDRATYVNNQTPCAETEAAIGLLKAAVPLFESRAARCHGRFTEQPLWQIIDGPVCVRCGHAGCAGTCRNA